MFCVASPSPSPSPSPSTSPSSSPSSPSPTSKESIEDVNNMGATKNCRLARALNKIKANSTMKNGVYEAIAGAIFGAIAGATVHKVSGKNHKRS